MRAKTAIFITGLLISVCSAGGQNQQKPNIILIMFFAATIGIILGGLVLMIIDATAGKGEDAILVNPTVDIPVILIAVATLVVLGTLIGMIPAQIAVSIKPIDALRDE